MVGARWRSVGVNASSAAPRRSALKAHLDTLELVVGDLLALLGRWSLSFYMLHQPVFIGAILGGRQLGWW